eukprot:scaffold649_cov347-Pavlova_lutheri.AAC.55
MPGFSSQVRVPGLEIRVGPERTVREASEPGESQLEPGLDPVRAPTADPRRRPPAVAGEPELVNSSKVLAPSCKPYTISSTFGACNGPCRGIRTASAASAGGSVLASA